MYTPDLGERMASMFESLGQFGKACEGMYGDEAFTHFNCTEVGYLTEVFVAAGLVSAARAVVLDHAFHDDHGDEHYGLALALDRSLRGGGLDGHALDDLADAYLGLRDQRQPGWTTLAVSTPGDTEAWQMLFASRADALLGLRMFVPHPVPDSRAEAAPDDDEALPDYLRTVHQIAVHIDEEPDLTASAEVASRGEVVPEPVKS